MYWFVEQYLDPCRSALSTSKCTLSNVVLPCGALSDCVKLLNKT